MPGGTHKFGGTWTELKLDVIAGYLGFYTTVLKHKPTPDRPFKLWYVDAFAGSGSRTVEITSGGMFEETPLQAEELEVAGSARRALEVDPPFHRFVFIEGHGGRFNDLAKLKGEFPGKEIDCKPGDSNVELRKLFQSNPWARQKGGKGEHRAVVFLDPYGMSVEWETLKVLAATGATDVWYLVPIEGINRQLSGDLDRVDIHKQIKLDEIFGTANWRAELYEPSEQIGLFGGSRESISKVGSKREIEAYALAQLGSLFRYVSEPIRLAGKGRGHIFSLVCLSNTESPAALALIKKGVKWLHDHYAFAAAASHQKSGH